MSDRFSYQSDAELKRLADVVWTYLGTKDPDQVREWIRTARSKVRDLQEENDRLVAFLEEKAL